MKLLLDENLPHKVAQLIQAWFPGSQHIRDIGFKGRPDLEIWSFAAVNAFTIVSKDRDFEAMSLLRGHPPKFVWIRIGNCTRESLLQLILAHHQDLLSFEADPVESMLVIS